MDPSRLVGPGTQVSYPSGARGRVEGRELVVETDGAVRRTSLGQLTPTVQAAVRLWSTEVPLGRSGHGYLVYLSFDGRTVPRLYVPAGTARLAPVRETSAGLDVMFGRSNGDDNAGFPYDTFTTGAGSALYTRVQLSGPRVHRYEVYRWQASGRAGSRPGAVSGVRIRPIDVGTYCFRSDTEAPRRC